MQTSLEHYHGFLKNNFFSKTLLFTLAPKALTLKKRKEKKKGLPSFWQELVSVEVLKGKECRSVFILEELSL